MMAGENIVTDLTNEYMNLKKYIVIHHVVEDFIVLFIIEHASIGFSKRFKIQ